MSPSFETIDLSQLPVPDAIQVPDAEAIFSAWLARLRELDPEFDALVESDPAFKAGEASAYQLLLSYQRVNDAVRAVLLASARKADLDQLGGNFDVERFVLEPADPDATPPVEEVLESDEDYRERIQLSWSKLSVAGPRNAYRYFARTADKDVLHAEAYGPEHHGQPGEVKVYVLARSGNGVASDALCQTVYDKLSPDEVRPLTDFVEVLPALPVSFQIEAIIEIPAGPDAQTVFDYAKTALQSYLDLSHRIGTMIPLSAIYAILHQPGVRRVKLLSPAADIDAVMGKAPWCVKSTLNMVENGV